MSTSEPVARLDGAADLVAEQRHYVVGQCLEAASAEIRFAARIQIAFAAQGVDQGAEQLLVEELGALMPCRVPRRSAIIRPSASSCSASMSGGWASMRVSTMA